MKTAAIYPPDPRVLRSYHDDWCVNVLLSDGRVYSYFTEMWLEHTAETLSGDPQPPGPETDRAWAAVMHKAHALSIASGNLNVPTWTLEEIPENDEQFHAGMNELCRVTSDADFRRFMR